MSGTTLADIFAENEFIAEHGEAFLPICQKCYFTKVNNFGDLCPICANEEKLGYEIMQLAGRCASGEERGRGTLYHAVPSWNRGKALCGARPGIRSVGWSSHHGEEVTCPRCSKNVLLQKAR